MYKDYKDYWFQTIKDHLECSDEEFQCYNNEEDIKKIFDYVDKQDWFWTEISDAIEDMLYNYKREKENK